MVAWVKVCFSTSLFLARLISLPSSLTVVIYSKWFTTRDSSSEYLLA